MPNLSVLNLMGNDAVREIRNYRCVIPASITSNARWRVNGIGLRGMRESMRETREK
jgi:L-amino acid N-acyltransferase YncA